MPGSEPPDTVRAVRVVVVAAVRMYREGLTGALSADPDIEVVAALATPPADLLAHAPDVLLLDVSRAHLHDAVRELRGRTRPPKIVVAAISERESDLLAYAEAGVSGYVTCEQPVEDVVAAVKAAARGELLCTPRVAASLVRHVALLAADRDATRTREPGLTRRELEIAGLIDRGMSNKQIAGTLQIEVTTVKNHVHHILEKLGVERRGEAAAHLRGPEPRPRATV